MREAGGPHIGASGACPASPTVGFPEEESDLLPLAAPPGA